MWRARYNHNWGLRFPSKYTELFFTVKPNDFEIEEAFEKAGVAMNEGWNSEENSGLVTLDEIIPVW